MHQYVQFDLSDIVLTMPTGRKMRGEIYVVDDDPVVRELLSLLLSQEGYEVAFFADGSVLLAANRHRQPVCIFLDLNIPGQSGLDVLKKLRAEGHSTPVIMISGTADIPTAVDAIRHGASDFIEKPLHGREVVARLEEAIAHCRQQPSQDLSSHFPGLTSREIDVLEQCMLGTSSKEAAKNLGISPRTIEDHRASLMRKLGARNTVDMVRIVMTASACEQRPA
jgi:FixJ family two-component response regulator